MRQDRQDYGVGLLFSTTGTYAALGQDGLDGALMALDEVNSDPSLGFRLRARIENPGGVIERYHALCEDMIRRDGCRHVVGTITSLSRKEIIPAIEKHDALLWYMCPYEGFECSDNVVYTGACPNQHIVPLFQHVLPRYGARACLVGSNYIWGWEINRIARALIQPCGGEVLSERYLPLGSEDVGRIVAEIAQKKPDFILNNFVGTTSYAFFRAMRLLAEQDPSFRPEIRPIVSCNLTECELGLIGEAGIGHLSSAIWFEEAGGPENAAFVARAKARLGGGRRPSAFFTGAYAAVRLLAEAIREAGTDDVAGVKPVLTARSFATPAGRLSIDPRTNHATLTPHLGRIAEGGRFDIIESAPEPMAPDPYLVHFDPDRLAALVAAARQAGDVPSSAPDARPTA
ncbi:transporter substrate-binding domain-containing protein [Azospirillum sp. SYSU D00513]|uniref:transporter substrate-binding protein n=1 Tax=Azospirillum sp. SYSU D00513 TaxID=2812561 RepID=UPI001A969027